MKKVCFVCLGNICRSTMAEFVMKSYITHQGIVVESRGTFNWEHGNPIHHGTQAILTKYEIPYDPTKTSQQISQADLQEFDYIIGMDQSNVEDLYAIASPKDAAKIALFNQAGVPDPWYTGDFEETYALVTKGCQEWLERIETDEK
ncbi:low molecular weight protein-tyrosine-phosphatase [Streptococcus halichoeri]|uniref:low molecular weight protein-tyrosine-phosphatase n=1 Tax=Streptococcus halichoeri TaxID=254785 RepID=UPI001356CF52|nr:low molecular weight protein-tyrosine-phosphatase [Streptococcus halichoeri]